MLVGYAILTQVVETLVHSPVWRMMAGQGEYHHRQAIYLEGGGCQLVES
jgi:hypothetical protein